VREYLVRDSIQVRGLGTGTCRTTVAWICWVVSQISPSTGRASSRCRLTGRVWRGLPGRPPHAHPDTAAGSSKRQCGLVHYFRSEAKCAIKAHSTGPLSRLIRRFRREGGRSDLWLPSRPGDYGRDQRKGRVRADEWSSVSMAVSSSESSAVTN
jgi:hypothetical protein